MHPLLILGAVVAVPVVVSGIARALRGHASPGAAQGGAGPESGAVDTRTILAYPGLAKRSPAFRKGLLDIADKLGIPVDSLATVIQGESGFDPTAGNPLPAAGLIQLTLGANLPGYTSKAAIEAVRKLSAEEQLPIIEAYYERLPSAKGADPHHLYMLNFLPDDAGKPDDFKLGDSQGSNFRQSVYKWNPGFDPEKKGYFTKADFYHYVDKIVAKAKGQRMNIAGAVLGIAPPSPPGNAKQAPGPAPMPAPKPAPPMPVESPDEPVWIAVDIPGHPGIEVTEPLTWEGVYRSVTMAELAQLADLLGGAPLTQKLADEARKQAGLRIVPPLRDASTETDHNAASQAWTDAVDTANADAIADTLSKGQYVDLGAKDWVLDQLTPDVATNYGLRKADESVYQTQGRKHNWLHRDWSQLARLWRSPGGPSEMAAIAGELGASAWAADRIANGWSTANA